MQHDVNSREDALGAAPDAPPADERFAAPEERERRVPVVPRVYLVQLDLHTPNQEQTLALGFGLLRAGWDARIFCREGARLAGRAQAKGLSVHTLPREGERTIPMLWSFFRGLKGHSKQPSVVHACDPAASLLAATAWRINKRLHIVHTRRVPVMESSVKAVKRYAVPDVDIITDTLAGKVALQLSGLSTQKVHVIPCGLDPSEYPASLPRGDGRFVYAVMGEMAEGNGCSLVYSALDILHSQVTSTPWEVRFLGNGPAFGKILDDAMTRGIAEHLVFLAEIDESEALRSCDCLILATEEGESYLPLILHGWACNVPVITVNRLDHAEILVADTNCLLVQPGDAAGLATQMARVSHDANLRRRLVKGGRAALARFSLKAMSEAHMKLYRRVFV